LRVVRSHAGFRHGIEGRRSGMHSWLHHRCRLLRGR
jgi:hypothetical protein